MRELVPLRVFCRKHSIPDGAFEYAVSTGFLVEGVHYVRSPVKKSVRVDEEKTAPLAIDIRLLWAFHDSKKGPLLHPKYETIEVRVDSRRKAQLAAYIHEAVFLEATLARQMFMVRARRALIEEEYRRVLWDEKDCPVCRHLKDRVRCKCCSRHLDEGTVGEAAISGITLDEKTTVRNAAWLRKDPPPMGEPRMEAARDSVEGDRILDEIILAAIQGREREDTTTRGCPSECSPESAEHSQDTAFPFPPPSGGSPGRPATGQAEKPTSSPPRQDRRDSRPGPTNATQEPC